VELAAPIAAALIGPGARRLMELETLTKRRFFLAGKPDMHNDHFVVLGEGKLADVAPESPVAEGAELHVELVEVDRHDGAAGVAHVDGIDVCVGDAAELVGKKVKVKIERVLDGVAYASLVRRAAKRASDPLTAEGEAEKPTRKPPARKAEGPAADVEVDAGDEAEIEAEAEAEAESGEEPSADGAAAKKKTRRGTRGGRNRKKKTTAATTAELTPDAVAEEPELEPEAERPEAEKAVTIHLPPDDLGQPEASENGDATARKRTRRGSRGGKNRRKREAAAAAVTNGGEEPAEPVDAVEEAPREEGWDYVPMSQWGDEFE
jgi:predicted RNA-binding protein with TRAM domain